MQKAYTKPDNTDEGTKMYLLVFLFWGGEYYLILKLLLVFIIVYVSFTYEPLNLIAINSNTSKYKLLAQKQQNKVIPLTLCSRIKNESI